jgi:NAD(P)-dependent dehydrogenase (short-subunit alcohol dehydrogenase family)
MKGSVLVTGGNSGIGRAIAKLMKQEGYDVTISGRNETALEATARELGTRYIVADMDNLNNVRMLAGYFRNLDVLVNNAGIGSVIPIGRYTEEDFGRHMNINVRAPLFLIQELLPALAHRRGAVTNISSVAASHGTPLVALYAASKAAIEAITRSLARELAPQNVRVNAVCPGYVDTPMFRKSGIPEDQLPGLREQHSAAIPLRRFGDPMEVAKVVLAQVEATYVTGAVWTVDGGLTA